MRIYKKVFSILTEKERQQVPSLLLIIFIGMMVEILGVALVLPTMTVISKPLFLENYPEIKSWIYVYGSLTHAQLAIISLLALVCVYFIKTLYAMFVQWRQAKFIFDVQADLSERLFIGYMKQPWAFHLQRNSAQLILNVTNEVNLFIGYVLNPSMSIITEGLLLSGIIILLFMVRPWETFAIVTMLSLLAFGFHHFVRDIILKWGSKRQFHEKLRIQHLQQGLGGVKDIKLLGRESNFFELYSNDTKESIKAGRNQKFLNDLPRLWLELFVVVSLLIFVVLMIVQGGQLDVLLPSLGVFAAAAFRLIPSANRILASAQSLRYGVPIVTMLYNETKLVAVSNQTEYNKVFPFRDKVEVQHISYKYQGAKSLVLKDINLTISIGASIGFIGETGVGKSTLIDIILGLLTPTQGSIMVDGVNIESNLRGWQDQIGYVPQNIFLTDDTIRKNIAFGLPDRLIDDVAIIKAIQMARLDEFINSLPKGMDTMVGERGVRLSGGQRQRIGIARALYHNPSILVLDEATSSLDIATEKKIMEEINTLQGDKTILIVAHRLSTIAKCDIVYKLERGRIVMNVDAGAIS